MHNAVEVDRATIVDEELKNCRRTGYSPWFYGSSFAAALAQLNEWLERDGGTCWQVLSIEPTADIVAVKRAYRKLVIEAHPDTGGSVEAFERLNAAYREAVEYATTEKHT